MLREYFFYLCEWVVQQVRVAWTLGAMTDNAEDNVRKRMRIVRNKTKTE